MLFIKATQQLPDSWGFVHINAIEPGAHINPGSPLVLQAWEVNVNIRSEIKDGLEYSFLAIIIPPFWGYIDPTTFKKLSASLMKFITLISVSAMIRVRSSKVFTSIFCTSNKGSITLFSISRNASFLLTAER